MSALKQAKFLGKTVLSLFLVFCLSACAPSRIELTPEQAHRYCEAHKEETKCFTNFYHGGIYHTLEWLAEYYQKSPPYSQLLCTLQVESVGHFLRTVQYIPSFFAPCSCGLFLFFEPFLLFPCTLDKTSILQSRGHIQRRTPYSV